VGTDFKEPFVKRLLRETECIHAKARRFLFPTGFFGVNGYKVAFFQALASLGWVHLLQGLAFVWFGLILP